MSDEVNVESAAQMVNDLLPEKSRKFCGKDGKNSAFEKEAQELHGLCFWHNLSKKPEALWSY